MNFGQVFNNYCLIVLKKMLKHNFGSYQAYPINALFQMKKLVVNKETHFTKHNTANVY